MSEIFYVLSVAAYFIGCAVLAAAIWAGIEGIYWIYCKVRGRDY